MDGFGVSPLEIMATEAYLQGLAWEDEFTYSAVFTGATALAASSNMDVQVIINGDSDFIVQEQNITCYDNAAPPVLVPDPNILCTLVRGGSGREVMNQAQHVANLFGSYQQNKHPGRKPFCALLGNAQILTVKLQNLSTTNFGRIDVSFTGFKVFYSQTQRPDKNGNLVTVTGDRQTIFHIG